MMHYFMRIDHEWRHGSGGPDLSAASAGPEMSHYASSRSFVYTFVGWVDATMALS